MSWSWNARGTAIGGALMAFAAVMWFTVIPEMVGLHTHLRTGLVFLVEVAGLGVVVAANRQPA